MQTHLWVWQIRLGRNLWESLVKMKNFNATLFSTDIYILFDLSCYRLGLCCPNLTLLTNLTETIWHKMGKGRQEEALGEGGGSSDNKARLGDFSVDTGPISLFMKCVVCWNAILQPFVVELSNDTLESTLSDLCAGLSHSLRKLFVWGAQPWTGLTCVRPDCSPIWTVQKASAVRLNTRELLEILEVHRWATCTCKLSVIIDINSCLLTCTTDMINVEGQCFTINISNKIRGMINFIVWD